MKKIALAFVVLFGFACATPSLAALQVDVNQGNVQPLPIAIPIFSATGPPVPILRKSSVPTLSAPVCSGR